MSDDKITRLADRLPDFNEKSAADDTSDLIELEIRAMQDIYNALSTIPKTSMGRVTRWATDRRLADNNE